MLKVYGSKVSYYTGKLESFLRYKGIPYEVLPLIPHQRRARKAAGASQMPVVECEDGRWMSDTTPILRHLEDEHPLPTVLPQDEAVGFVAQLLEDYADEWLWRPAMHYRWSYPHSRELLARILVDEQTGHLPLPSLLKRLLIKRRQLGGFVRGDGLRRETWEHVERGYFAALDNMSRMLSERRYLLGDAPSLADFGFMGPMLRHFGQDPVPAELMRERAPAVYAWVARMWEARRPQAEPRFLDSVPKDAAAMLQEVCETHLVQLGANARAFAQGRRRFAMTVQGCEYVELPVSRYRVACAEQLREAFAGLAPEAQRAVRELLPHAEAELLWSEDFRPRSGYDEERAAPFNRAINVYGDGVPR